MELTRSAKIQTVVFDKTGTTIIVPLVTDVVGDEARVLTLAASLETFRTSTSPKAVLSQAEEKGLVLSPVENFQAIEGKRVQVKSTSSWDAGNGAS